MQLLKQWQPRRCLPVEQHQDQRKFWFFYTPVNCLVVFRNLPGTKTLFANEENECGSVRNLLHKLGQPIAAGSKTFRRKKNPRAGVAPMQRALERLNQGEILRVVAEKPAPHSKCARPRVLPSPNNPAGTGPL